MDASVSFSVSGLSVEESFLEARDIFDARLVSLEDLLRILDMKEEARLDRAPLKVGAVAGRKDGRLCFLVAAAPS